MTPRTRRLVAIGAGVLACLVTARLGIWQMDRAEQKLARQRLVDERRQLPPLPPAELARTEDAASTQWQRRFAAEGRWVPQATVYLDNRPMDGQAGFYVVTPLQLADGRGIAVVRGWASRDPVDRTRLPPVATPTNQVAVQGHLAPWPSALYGLGAESPGPIRQNLDPVAYQREAGVPLAPVVLQLDDPSPTPAAQADAQADGLRRNWPAPAVDVHKHYGYAAQWFAMSAIALGLTAWFQFIRPIRTARAKRRP